MAERFYNIDPETCPIEELEKIIADLNDKVGFYETQQLAVKKFINSVYGATASGYFVGFNPNVAEAITLQGQHLNHFSEKTVNDYFKGPFQADTELHKKLGIKTEDTININVGHGKLQPADPLVGKQWEYLGDTESLIIAGDTDSVSANSIIYLNGEKASIENAFNELKELAHDCVLKVSQGNEVVPVSEKNQIKTLTFDTINNEVVERPIRYIMRHKVNKPKWKVRTKSGKEVIITNDHSIMVIRDNSLIKITASEINKDTDKLVSICS